MNGGSSPRLDAKAGIVVIGEAKSPKKPRTPADVDRLERIRRLLTHRGWDADQAQLALFSRESFDANLTRLATDRPDLHLIDLDTLYRG